MKVLIKDNTTIINELIHVLELKNKKPGIPFVFFKNDLEGELVSDKSVFFIEKDIGSTNIPFVISESHTRDENFLKLSLLKENTEIASKHFIFPKIIYNYFTDKISILETLRTILNILDNLKVKSIVLSQEKLEQTLKSLEEEYGKLQERYESINNDTDDILLNKSLFQNQQVIEILTKQNLLNQKNIPILKKLTLDELEEIILLLNKNRDYLEKLELDMNYINSISREEFLDMINTTIDIKYTTNENIEIVKKLTQHYQKTINNTVLDFVNNLSSYRYIFSLHEIEKSKDFISELLKKYSTFTYEHTDERFELMIEYDDTKNYITQQYIPPPISEKKKKKKIITKKNKIKLPVIKNLGTLISNILDSATDLDLTDISHVVEIVTKSIMNELSEPWTEELLRKEKSKDIEQVIRLYIQKDDIIKYNNKNKEYKWLSTFSKKKPFLYLEKQYSTVEHAFQAQKLDPSDPKFSEYQNYFTIEGLTVKDAKQYGSTKKFKENGFTLRKDWEANRLPIMENIIREFFKVNPKELKKLTETENKILLHISQDSFWGVKDGIGENHHGKILMKLREELKSRTLQGGTMNENHLLESTLQEFKNQTIKNTKNVPTDNSFFYSVIEYLLDKNLFTQFKLSEYVSFQNISSDIEIQEYPVYTHAMYQLRILFKNILLQYRTSNLLLDVIYMIEEKYRSLENYISLLESCDNINITNIELYLCSLLFKINIHLFQKVSDSFKITTRIQNPSYSSTVEFLKIQDKYFYLTMSNQYNHTSYEKIDLHILPITYEHSIVNVVYTDDQYIKIVGIYENGNIQKVKDKKKSKKICDIFKTYMELENIENVNTLQYWKDIVTNKLYELDIKTIICNQKVGTLREVGIMTSEGSIKCVL